MASQNPNRGTQFMLEGLTGLGQSSSISEPGDHVVEKQQPSQERQDLKKNAPKRKSSLSPPRDGAMDVRGVRPYDFICSNGSPWKGYRKVFQLKFNHFLTVAVQKNSPAGALL